MRGSKVSAAVFTVMMLAACTHPRNDNMKVQLDKIRAMVSQSALMAAQAACVEQPDRSELIDAAVVMLRRATAGPEMASIHQMMGGEMKMDTAGSMPANSGGGPASPQQAMHIAVHAAGGDAFDLLDALSGQPILTCADLRPVSLAATAALLRERHEQHDQGVDEATKKLDLGMDTTAERIAGEVQQSITDKTPAAVRILALALQKI